MSIQAGASRFDLSGHHLTVSEVHHNLPVSTLAEHAIRYDKGASIAMDGALVAYSGEKTGRSPQDKRVVKHLASEQDIWWSGTRANTPSCSPIRCASTTSGPGS
jgi:phosphoenolpyruvate carboxykinase (ATP)